MSNPVHEDGGKWYFWYETWADRQGPFDTEREAKDACREYARVVLGDGVSKGPDPPAAPATDGDETEGTSEPQAPDAPETPKSTGMDLRPRCCRCQEKWWPPEGVDAQEVPCPACRRRDEMSVVPERAPTDVETEDERRLSSEWARANFGSLDDARLLECVADAYGDFCEAHPDPGIYPPPWVEEAQDLLGESRACEIHRLRATEAPMTSETDDARREHTICDLGWCEEHSRKSGRLGHPAGCRFLSEGEDMRNAMEVEAAHCAGERERAKRHYKQALREALAEATHLRTRVEKAEAERDEAVAIVTRLWKALAECKHTATVSAVISGRSRAEKIALIVDRALLTDPPTVREGDDEP